MVAPRATACTSRLRYQISEGRHPTRVPQFRAQGHLRRLRRSSIPCCPMSAARCACHHMQRRAPATGQAKQSGHNSRARTTEQPNNEELLAAHSSAPHGLSNGNRRKASCQTHTSNCEGISTSVPPALTNVADKKRPCNTSISTRQQNPLSTFFLFCDASLMPRNRRKNRPDSKGRVVVQGSKGSPEASLMRS